MVNVPSFRPNVDFPQLCNQVKVDWDEKRGRSVKATEDIPMGTVVCVEMGITVNLDPQYCYRCLSVTNDSEYAYCDTCEEFYEPDELAQGKYDDLGLFKLAAHLVFTYPFSEMLDLIQRYEDPKPPKSAPKSLSTSEIVSIYQLTPFPEIGENFKVPRIQKAIKDIVISLETDVNWGRLDFNARRMTFLKGLRIMAERCAKNAHTVYSISQKESDEEIPMGTGMFPIASIFNHSCTPNVFAFFVQNTFIFVSRGVRAGEELVDSYGAFYQQHSLQQRTEFLANVSGFECFCNSCEEQKSLDGYLEKQFDDISEWAETASVPRDLSDRLQLLPSGSKEFEDFIIAFSRKSESELFMDSMYKFWKQFIENAKIRGIDFDPYLIRPYIEMVVLVWTNEVDATNEEKASMLMVVHRLVQNFYLDFHPLSVPIKRLIDDAKTGNQNYIRNTVDRLKWTVRSIWKLEEYDN